MPLNKIILINSLSSCQITAVIGLSLQIFCSTVAINRKYFYCKRTYETEIKMDKQSRNPADMFNSHAYNPEYNPEHNKSEFEYNVAYNPTAPPSYIFHSYPPVPHQSYPTVPHSFPAVAHYPVQTVSPQPPTVVHTSARKIEPTKIAFFSSNFVLIIYFFSAALTVVQNSGPQPTIAAQPPRAKKSRCTRRTAAIQVCVVILYE